MFSLRTEYELWKISNKFDCRGGDKLLRHLYKHLEDRDRYLEHAFGKISYDIYYKNSSISFVFSNCSSLSN